MKPAIVMVARLKGSRELKEGEARFLTIEDTAKTQVRFF
jgi:hypothetical protein